MTTSATQFASRLLEQDCGTYSKLVYSRLQNHPSLAAQQTDAANSQRWMRRIDKHLQTLAACIRFESPRLLVDYVKWGTRLPDSQCPDINEVRTLYQIFGHVVEEELPIQAASIIGKYIELGLDAENAPLQESAESTPPRLTLLQQKYLTALLSTNRIEALQIAVDALQAGSEISDFYLDVLQPVLIEVGRRWQTGEISVAQEHFCTATTQYVMGQLQPYFLNHKQGRHTLLAFCVGDELHEVGLRMLTDLFEMDGWKTIYLGANVPAESLSRSLSDYQADVVAISVTMTRHLLALPTLIELLRSQADHAEVKILGGGYPFKVDPFLWRRVGVDAGAKDAAEAIRIANGWMKQKPSKKGLEKTKLSQVPGSPHPLEHEKDHEDFSRLNNELITAQRQLNQTILELRRLNTINEEKAKALQEADRRKNEFLAMLAHELRGPLAPINHALTLMGMDNVEPTIQVEARDTIQRQIQHMAHLISDLLDASRIAHGKINLAMRTVTLSDIIERAIEVARPLIEEKQHDLRISESEGIFLEGDEIRLVQVVANLLTNAAKYTDKGGTIWLTTEQNDHQAVIEVRDNGIGLEPGQVKTMFEVFTQDQRGQEHSQGGLGLGLSLVKQLVELHQGTVLAASEGIGKGCVFTIRLSALDTVEIPTAEDIVFEENLGIGSCRRVLIVDDTRGSAQITGRLFEILGHKSQVALSGQAALEQATTFQPEIVILDLILPGMSGFEIAKQLRLSDQGSHMLLVALTGNSDNENRQRAKEAGIDEYLVKPVDIQELKKLFIHPKLVEVNGTH